MAYTIEFPKDNQQCENALNSMIEAAEEHRHVHEVNWWMVHYYLQGCREFSALDYTRGVVDVSYYNQRGELQFIFDWLTSKYQTQLGRLMQINLMPRVTKRNVGLEDMRKASTAQVALNEAFDKDQVDRVKAQVLPPILKYGTAGLVVWNEGETVGIDVCPPWEMLPIPPAPVEASDLRGKARVRLVPLEWVKELAYAPARNAKIWDQMDTVEVLPGQMPTGTQEKFNTFGQQVGVDNQNATEIYGSRKAAKQSQETRTKIVKFVEIWVEDSQGLLKEYLVLAGKKLIHRQDYRARRMHTPAQIATDIPTAGFWCRSFCSTLMPLNTELELSLQNLFQNLQDMDAFGILMEPTTMGLPAVVERGADGLKRARFEPDYTAPDLKPFNIAPANTGTMPIEAIKVAIGVGGELANQPTELMQGQAPGRVDSTSGLGFLMETSNLPISPTATSLAMAMVGCYKCMLDIIHTEWKSDKVVGVTLLDDSIAGVQMDPQTGNVTLAANSIPKAAEVQIDVQSMMPKSTEQEKLELSKALEMQAITMTEYQIEVRKRGLGLPVGGEAEWQNYRRAVMNNIVLFGDGQKPGQVVVSPSDMHMIHMQVLLAFMGRPEFYLASPQVREAFLKCYEAHQMGDGQLMPDQAPYPEDAAEEQDMMDQLQSRLMQGQPMAGGGSPPPPGM